MYYKNSTNIQHIFVIRQKPKNIFINRVKQYETSKAIKQETHLTDIKPSNQLKNNSYEKAPLLKMIDPY